MIEFTEAERAEDDLLNAQRVEARDKERTESHDRGFWRGVCLTGAVAWAIYAFSPATSLHDRDAARMAVGPTDPEWSCEVRPETEPRGRIWNCTYHGSAELTTGPRDLFWDCAARTADRGQWSCFYPGNGPSSNLLPYETEL